MNNEEELLEKRFLELAAKSERGAYFTFTDFLGLAELSVFSGIKRDLRCAYTLFGGHSETERVMVRFGNEEELGYSEPFPIKIIKIYPTARKFAEKLGHRDYLGTILGLGIERSVIGDILIFDTDAYVFVKSDMADYIASSLERVRHTTVRAEIISEDELPEGELFRTEGITVQLAGERLDALVAKVFSLSRDEALGLFRRRLVFVGGALCENNSATPRVGDVISVRGHGKMIYRGQIGVSKKGKLNVLVDKYV